MSLTATLALCTIGGAMIGHSVVVLISGLYSRAVAAVVLLAGLIITAIGNGWLS